MISLVQAIRSKTSCNFNTANTEHSGTEVAPKASDHKVFFDKIYPEEEASQKNERNFRIFLRKKGSDGRTTPVSFNTFKDSDLLALFINYNTAVPSSAVVERLFFLGKDVLKPKRVELTNKHFEMLVFLKEAWLTFMFTYLMHFNKLTFVISYISNIAKYGP